MIPQQHGSGATQQGPLAIGEAFGSRYHITSLLGLGGMGAVYKAWDAELGVNVALKVVRPEIVADPDAARTVERRFKQELLLARKVTHRNVVRIHDIGEVNGIKYITMPFIEGEDLADILKREGKLPATRVMSLARTMVSGLAAAHEAGIVHRDLKPANIMVGAEGEALIMDFGVARSTGSETPPIPGLPGLRMLTPANQTVAGSIVGTLEYMAPEQVRAEAVDQRADIYAVGLILYDMLLGRKRAKHNESAIAELTRRMVAVPQPLRQIDPSIPEALERIVSRCVQPDPAARFQTTQELVAELARLDDHAKPLPAIRRLTRRVMATAGVLVLVLLGGTFYMTKQYVAPPTQHDPVTLVIADIQNTTGDKGFDQVLEPMLRRALEGAGFITAYDRSRIRSMFGIRPPERFTETTARELAVKQGLGVVLSGSIGPRGSGYELSMKAQRTVTGDVVVTATGRASDKSQVLAAATKLVTTVRTALGDETSDSAQLFTMRSISTASMDVVGHYAAAMQDQSNGQYEKALASFSKAVELDPKFGLGYSGLAVMSLNLGRPQDAEKYINEALRHLDGMTDRERLSTRGFYYKMTGDYQQCAREYGELIARFAADTVAHNQLAGCLAKQKNMRGAVDAMRRAVEILPKHKVYRANLALLHAYASDFQSGEREVRLIAEPDVRAMIALAFSQLGQGRPAESKESYQKLAGMGPLGASLAASGLGDLAQYEGRFSDAMRIYDEGSRADLKAGNADGAARKLISAASARLSHGRPVAALAAARSALLNSKAVDVQFRAGRIFVETGDLAAAGKIAAALAAELPLEAQAYGKILEAQLVLKSGDARQAIKLLTDANNVLDTWLGHFDLGRAYLAAGALPQADSEFDRCTKRRGEALSLFDEDATYAYFPAVYYYQGLVRERLNTTAFADSYREYLKIRGSAAEDPLLDEIRRRATPRSTPQPAAHP